MANSIGACGYCGESCDRDDPDRILVIGEVERDRLHVVLCSFDHLVLWSARENVNRDHQRHVRKNVDKHPLSGHVCDTCRI